MSGGGGVAAKDGGAAANDNDEGVVMDGSPEGEKQPADVRPAETDKEPENHKVCKFYSSITKTLRNANVFFSFFRSLSQLKVAGKPTPLLTLRPPLSLSLSKLRRLPLSLFLSLSKPRRRL